MVDDPVPQALRLLSSLLRRRGTSPEVGRAIRRTIQTLESALASGSRFARTAAMEEGAETLRSCLAIIAASRVTADQQQLPGVRDTLLLLTSSLVAAPVDVPTALDQPSKQAAPPSLPPPHERNALVSRRRARPWDLFEEHLDEAAFLWTQWEDALVAANFTLMEVAGGPEERLLAHLDGLVLGGRAVAHRILLPALVAEEPERISAAAWALAQAEDGEDYQDAVTDLLVAAPGPARTAVERSLGLSARMDGVRIERFWHAHASATVRSAAFQLLGVRDPTWASANLHDLLKDEQPPMVAAGLRALRRSPDRAFADFVRRQLSSQSPAILRDALMTGIAFGLEDAWEICRARAAEGGEECRLPLALLATSSNPADRTAVQSATEGTAVRRHALWALGFAGDLAAADALVEATADPEVAGLAAESLSAITGLALEGALVAGAQTRGPTVPEVGDDDPPPALRREDFLAKPHAPAIKDWWRRNRPRFTAGLRYIHGSTRTPDAINAALVTAPMWRREVLWLELARLTGGAPSVDLRTWAREQSSSLAADQPQRTMLIG